MTWQETFLARRNVGSETHIKDNYCWLEIIVLSWVDPVPTDLTPNFDQANGGNVLEATKLSLVRLTACEMPQSAYV